MQYEIVIGTYNYIGNSNEKEIYTDNLITALARFGYSPYLSEEGNVLFTLFSENDIIAVDKELKDYSDQIL